MVALTWTVNAEARIVFVTARGDVSRAEFDAFLDWVVANDALAYGKLFDGSAGDTSMGYMDLLAIGWRLKSYHDRPVGALAIVLPPDKFELVARILGILATAKRPMRLFKTRAAAQRWLFELDHTPPVAVG